MGADPLDRLYAAPLGKFTAERDALAAEIRKDGEAERAKEVKALRKPTVTAWAVNQAARRGAKQVAALLRAGEALREAQGSLSGRGGRDELRSAQELVRRCVRELREQAEAALADTGKPASQAAREQIDETLHAAAVDPELGELLMHARLERPGRAIGFVGLDAAPAPARADKASRKRSALEKRLGTEEDRLADATRLRKAAEADLRSAERAAKDAAQELDRASRQARAAARRETELGESLERLRKDLSG